MSGLDQLTAKIIRDAEEKAGEILRNAEEEAAKITDGFMEKARAKKDDILSQGKREAQMTKSRIVSGKQLEIRDAKLKAKQSMLEKVTAMAADRLNACTEEEFREFLKTVLLETDITGGEELVLPERFRGIDLNGINEALSAADKPGQLRIAGNGRMIDGGFILVKGGVENNNTFGSLLSYYGDAIEHVVVENLF